MKNISRNLKIYVCFLAVVIIIIATGINFIHAQDCASQSSSTCNDLQCKWSYPTCSDFECSVRQNFNCYDPTFTFRQSQTSPIPTGLDRTCFWASDPSSSSNGGMCTVCSTEYPPCPSGCMTPPSGDDGGGPGGPSLCIRSCQYTIPGPSTCDAVSLCQTDTTQSATNSALWVCRDKDPCSGMASRQNCSSRYCDWDSVTRSCAINTCRSRLNQVACETKSVYDNVRCQWDSGSSLSNNGTARCVETVDCAAFTSDRTLCNSKPCCGMLDDPSNPSNSVCSVMCSCLMSSSNCLSGAAAMYCTWRSGSSSASSPSLSPSYCTPNGVATCAVAKTKISCYNSQSPSNQAYSCNWFSQAELPPTWSSAYATTVSTSSQCLMLPCFLRTYEQCLSKSANDDVAVLECFTYNTSTGAMKCGGCSRSRTTNPTQTMSESSAGFPCDWDPACELDTLRQQCKRRCATYGTHRLQCDGDKACSFDASYTSQISFTRRQLGSGIAPVVESLMTNCYKALIPCPMYLRSPIGTPAESCIVGSAGNCQDYPAVAPYTSSENCLQICSVFNGNKTSGMPPRRAKCAATPECRWSTSSNSCVDACWRAILAWPDVRSVCEDSTTDGGGSECQWTATTTVSNFSSYITNINVQCYPLPICNRYGSNQTACQSAAQMYFDGGNISQCEWKATSDSFATTGLCTIKCHYIVSETICSKGQGGWCRWDNVTSSCVPDAPVSTTTTTKQGMTTTATSQQVTGNTNSNPATSTSASNAVTAQTANPNGQTTIRPTTTSATATRVSTSSTSPQTQTTKVATTTTTKNNQQTTSSPNVSPSTALTTSNNNNNNNPRSTTTTTSTTTTFPPATKPQTTVTVTLNQTKPYDPTQLQSQLASDLGISADNIALTQINSSTIQITFVNTGGTNSSSLVQKLSNFSSSQLESLGLVNALAAPGESWTTTVGPTPTPEAKSDGKSNAGLLGAVIGGTLAFFIISFVAYRYIKKNNRKRGARSGDDFENGGDEEFGVSASKAFQIDFDQDDADFANPFESPQQQAAPKNNNNNNAAKRAANHNTRNAFETAPSGESRVNNPTSKPKKPRRRSDFDQFGDDI